MSIRIHVTTTGLLGEYLPAGSDNNRAEIEVEDGATPLDVIRQLGMPVEDNYLVSLNDTVVPKSERAKKKLSDNDTLAIMSPIKAG